MSDDPIVLRTYATEVAAELARATLEANGVSALVRSADAAGLLRYVQGVELLVRAEDAELALELLDGDEDEDDDADEWETAGWDEADDADDEER